MAQHVQGNMVIKRGTDTFLFIITLLTFKLLQTMDAFKWEILILVSSKSKDRIRQTEQLPAIRNSIGKPEVP